MTIPRIGLAAAFSMLPCAGAFAGQQPVERTESLAVNAERLLGRWSADEDCLGGTTLRADGTFALGDGGGRWRLSGSTLTVTLERPPSGGRNIELGEGGTAFVAMDGPDAIVVDYGWESGGYKMFIRYRRCG